MISLSSKKAAVAMDETTLWTEEKIITKVIDEQQKNFLNIIRGNFEFSKQKIAELKMEINELRKSKEHA